MLDSVLEGMYNVGIQWRHVILKKPKNCISKVVAIRTCIASVCLKGDPKGQEVEFVATTLLLTKYIHGMAFLKMTKKIIRFAAIPEETELERLDTRDE